MHSRFTVPFTAKVNYGVSQGHLRPPPHPPRYNFALNEK